MNQRNILPTYKEIKKMNQRNILPTDSNKKINNNTIINSKHQTNSFLTLDRSFAKI